MGGDILKLVDFSRHKQGYKANFKTNKSVTLNSLNIVTHTHTHTHTDTHTHTQGNKEKTKIHIFPKLLEHSISPPLHSKELAKSYTLIPMSIIIGKIWGATF